MDSTAITTVTRNKNTNSTIKLYKFIIWPLGLWPLENDGYFSQFRRAFCLVSQLWILSTLSLSTYHKCGDSSESVDIIMLGMCGFLAFTKIITFRVHREKLRRVMLSALQVWTSNDITKFREILMPFKKTGLRVFFILIFLSYFSNISIIIAPLSPVLPNNETSWNHSLNQLSPTRQLPLKTGCLFAHYTNGIYFSLYVYESITLMITAHGNVGCDVVIFILTMHLCGQIELLKLDLIQISSNKEEEVQVYRSILRFIRKHCELLELSRFLDKTVSGMLIIQLCLDALLNLMLGIRILLAIASGQTLDGIRPVTALNVIMLKLYLLSYASNRLNQQADSVLDLIYDCNWYEMPIKYRKILHFAMSRPRGSNYLTAGNFYNLSLENFKNILKASFSYFSILRLMFNA